MKLFPKFRVATHLMLVSTRVLLISKLLYLLLESFNIINFREKKFLVPFKKPNYFQNLIHKIGQILAITDVCLPQNECVAENKMHHGTHLLRQHNQLKWRCYFPLCPGIFLHKPSYLSLRWTVVKRKIYFAVELITLTAKNKRK